jgi:hypothetical protein
MALGVSAAHFGQVRQVLFDSSFEFLLSLGEDDCCVYIWNSDDM